MWPFKRTRSTTPGSFQGVEACRRAYARKALSVEQLEARRVLATFMVTNVNDSGPGSLRQAILDSNERIWLDEIRFDIPLPTPLLQPTTLLPEIVDQVILDATTQAGYSNFPVVQIDGGLVAQDGDGLKLRSGGSTIRGLSITGFRRAGIFIDGAGHNVIQANYIGVDLSGAQASPNQFAGLIISDSMNNRIGGAASVDGNVISGNAGDGIRIEGSQSLGNFIQGNLIGTDAQASTAIPNRSVGVLVQGGAARTVIGSDSNGFGDAAEGNVISGNLRSGITLRDATEQNVVAGNYIGTDGSGSGDLGNVVFGVAILGNSQYNVIGIENGVGRANVISGNEQAGVYLESSHQNIIAGNLIGLDSSGKAALPNATQGVFLNSGSQRNRVGTDDNGVGDASERNIISGNEDQGISIVGEGTDHNWVAGNFIGTDITGLVAVPNTSTGIQITNFAQFNHVGRKTDATSSSAAGNLISGNSGWGIRFRNHASDNVAAGNKIGTDVSGMVPLPNMSSGIGTYQLATGNVIGGASPHMGNLISGNHRWGIEIEHFSGANRILGNSIGLAVDGVSPLGNGTGGIRVISASSNQIGNATTAGANQIAFNAEVGIQIVGDNSTENLIAVNSIYSQAIAIDLGGDGVTPNDIDDRDLGPNQLQNTPLVHHAVSVGMGSQVAGSLHGLPHTEFRIELYASPSEAGLGQGSRYLGRVLTRTDDLGYANWLVDLVSSLESDDVITATASDPLGNTSEFSAPLKVAVPLELEVENDYFAEDVGIVQLKIGRGSVALTENLLVRLTGLPPELGDMPSEVLIVAGEAFVSVPITIHDNSRREENVAFTLFASTDPSTSGRGASGALQLTLVDDDTGDWHNLFLAEDINGDQIVSPLDALLIVNFLNSDSNPLVSLFPPALPRVYLDTDNNGIVSPIDALLVVNYLNRNSQAVAEGEFAGGPPLNQVGPWWLSLDELRNKRLEYARLRSAK